jgi:hypothetical protein
MMFDEDYYYPSGNLNVVYWKIYQWIIDVPTKATFSSGISQLATFFYWRVSFLFLLLFLLLRW